ncbi:hypothetical protein GGR53DRAFT_271503 [Hypoxylon sp. FL1150]|nr:hypothetical protein GGR53DRAFT_271503 [Hypoxylon sp. FL1150]
MTAPSVPRVRARKPKVRTGCATCKSRRIKCDEARPACLRCQKSRLLCQYRDSPGAEQEGSKEQRNILPASQQLMSKAAAGVRLNPRVKREDFLQPEVYYFDLFRHIIVDNVCQNGYISLWSHTILRETFRDECVRYAVLGIGALCRALMDDNQQVNVKLTKPLWTVPTIAVSCPKTKYHRDAIKYYMKSIARFRNQISREGSATPNRTIIIISILFILFETMQGDTDSIDRIMVSAITALKANLRQEIDTQRQVSSALDDDGVREADCFLTCLSGFSPILSPLHHSLLKSKAYEGSRILGNTIPAPAATPLQTEQAFERYTTSALIWCFRTVSPQGGAYGHPVDAMKHQEEQLSISTQADEWCEYLTKNLEKETDPWQRRTWKIMLMEAKMFSIYTTYCEDAAEHERMWDSRVDDCREAVALAESVLGEPTPFNSLPPMFEDKLLPTLRCFICKCRDKKTRARALRICTQLAGPWFENRAILVGLQIVIAMEERERDPCGFIPIRLRYRWDESTWNEDRTQLNMVLTRIVTGARREFTVHSDWSIEDMLKKLGKPPDNEKGYACKAPADGQGQENP